MRYDDIIGLIGGIPKWRRWGWNEFIDTSIATAAYDEITRMSVDSILKADRIASPPP